MDLKIYFDRAKADSDEATRLQSELDAKFNEGTDEGIQAAIDMQPALEAAVKKSAESNKLYLTMRDAANHSGGAASLFVSDDAQDETENNEKVLSLSAFNALSPRKRLEFSKAGGKIEN